MGTVKKAYSVFGEPLKIFSSQEIKRIRIVLVGPDMQKWADMFVVSIDQVKAWEVVEGSKRHRECSGSSARLMMLCARMAKGKSNRNGLIRAAALGFKITEETEMEEL